MRESITFELMVTQTWAWLKSQLDYPKYKQIKVHIINNDTLKSFCGLTNHHDTGELTLDETIKRYDDFCCKKCLKSVRMRNETL